ncbi:MAG: septum formation initiator family protein [Pseudomonadota bacterium]
MKNRRFAITLIGAAATVYLGLHLVSGDHGLLAWREIEGDLATKTEQLDALRAEEEALRRSIATLRSANPDQDLLDERAREVLGVAGETEYVIYVDDFVASDPEGSGTRQD